MYEVPVIAIEGAIMFARTYCDTKMVACRFDYLKQHRKKAFDVETPAKSFG